MGKGEVDWSRCKSRWAPPGPPARMLAQNPRGDLFGGAIWGQSRDAPHFHFCTRAPCGLPHCTHGETEAHGGCGVCPATPSSSVREGLKSQDSTHSTPWSCGPRPPRGTAWPVPTGPCERAVKVPSRPSSPQSWAASCLHCPPKRGPSVCPGQGQHLEPGPWSPTWAVTVTSPGSAGVCATRRMPAAGPGVRRARRHTGLPRRPDRRRHGEPCSLLPGQGRSPPNSLSAVLAAAGLGASGPQPPSQNQLGVQGRGSG